MKLRVRRRRNDRTAVVSPSDVLRVRDSSPKRRRVVRPRFATCVSSDCKDAEIQVDDMRSVYRFTTGFVKYKPFGAFFEEKALFPDATRHKYAHGVCILDAIRGLEYINMEECAVCQRQFFCEVEPMECCLLVERGYVTPGGKMTLATFQRSDRGAVHWACARTAWPWELFTGFSMTFDEEPLSL